MYVCVYGQAVNDNGDLMRMAIASPGNDFRFPLSGKSALPIRNLNDAMYVCMYVFRLGACEAPPAIVSVYLGDDMTQYLESFMSKRP